MELTKHAEELLKKSYYQKDTDNKVIEDWNGLCTRVAKHIAKGDYCKGYELRDITVSESIPYTAHLYNRKNKKDMQCCGTCSFYKSCLMRKEREIQFFDLLYNQYFIVNTPSLMNCGTELGGLSACFILPVEDSMESILDAVKKSGIILKTGGGVGVSFAKVRQKGAKVGSTGGSSSGVISWLKIFNQVVEEVKQGGRRRGAMSATLPVNHPDILEFIKCKTDNTAITNFNISVGITDEFMQKVQNNERYDLIEPHTGNVAKTISATEVFNTIAEQAFKNGEPGLLFLDRVNKDNPVPKMGDILSGNPCTLSSTLFLTKEKGIQPLVNLKIGDIVWTGKQWSSLLNIWSTGVKPVYRYTTSKGFSIDLTEDHRIVQNGTKIKVKDALSIDGSICGEEFNGLNVEESFALLAGLVQGDGSMQKNAGVSAYLNVGKKDNDHYSFIEKYVDSINTKGLYHFYKLNTTFTELHIEYKALPERTISDFWMTTNSKTMRVFLKGLFSANGCFIKSANRIALKSTNLDLVKKVQMMLSSVGIISYYTTNKPSTIKWDNGTYTSKMSYDLNITSDIIKFKNEIGFTQQYKMEAITNHVSNGRTNLNKVKNKEYLGELEVFDFTVEAVEHTAWANGLLISNCMEYTAIPLSSCTLGAVNLSKIISQEVQIKTKKLTNFIDYKVFDSIISTAARMLDNTITMNKFPIPEIEEVTLANRPIGLGFLNLSELFIKLGLVYGSDESLEMAGTVTSYMRKKAIEASIELAKERGSYPNFDANDWYSVNRNYMESSGTIPLVRNSTVLSIAPNGSTGVIVNASSGGVEPIFAVSYKRKTVDCGDMHMVNPLFEEMMEQNNKENGCAWKTGGYENMLSKIEDNAGSVKGISNVPEKIQKLFVTAREIPYEQHIKMQASVQQNIDLAVSKTCNLLSDATVADVKNAYIMAHELGCKGITIYREGSRENEVLSTKKKEYKEGDKIEDGSVSKIKESSELTDLLEKWDEIENPKIDKHSYKNPIEQLWAESPIEVEEETYEDEYDYIVEPRERKDMVVGYTYKISLHGMKVYITINFNEDEMTPIETFILAGKPGDDINAIAQSIGRLVSLSLKFKVPIDEIMQQIDSMAGDEIVWMGGDKILSIPDAVAKALKWAMKKRKETLGSQPVKEVMKIVEKKESKENNSSYKELRDSKEIKTFLGKNKCPNCGDTLVFQEGCRKCLSCDYNKCG